MGKIIVSSLHGEFLLRSYNQPAWPREGVAERGRGWFGALSVMKTQPGLQFHAMSLPFGFLVCHRGANSCPSIHPLFLPLTNTH